MYCVEAIQKHGASRWMLQSHRTYRLMDAGAGSQESRSVERVHDSQAAGPKLLGQPLRVSDGLFSRPKQLFACRLRRLRRRIRHGPRTGYGAESAKLIPSTPVAPHGSGQDCAYPSRARGALSLQARWVEESSWRAAAARHCRWEVPAHVCVIDGACVMEQTGAMVLRRLLSQPDAAEWATGAVVEQGATAV